MKYIRTEDGIYRVLQYGSAKKHYVVISVGLGHKVIDTSEIIKQANTIEELCDEFVVREYHYGDYFPIKTDAHYSYNSFTLLSDAKGYRDLLAKSKGKALYDLFCAIWTDKGLIYVAKMNENGDMVLL